MLINMKTASAAIVLTMIIGAAAKPVDNAVSIGNVQGRGVSATMAALSSTTCTDEPVKPTISVSSNSGGHTIVHAAYTPLSYIHHASSETPVAATTSTFVSVSLPSDVSTPVAFTDTSSITFQSSSSIVIVVSTTLVSSSEGVSVSASSSSASTNAVYDSSSTAVPSSAVSVTSSNGVSVPASGFSALPSSILSVAIGQSTAISSFKVPSSTEETVTIISTATAIPLPSLSRSVVFTRASSISSDTISNASSAEIVISSSSLASSVPAAQSTSAPSTATVEFFTTQNAPTSESTSVLSASRSIFFSTISSIPVGYVGSSVVTPQSSVISSAPAGDHTSPIVLPGSSASETGTFYSTTITGTTTVTPVHSVTRTEETTVIVYPSSHPAVQSTNVVSDNSGESSTIVPVGYLSVGVPPASSSAQTLTTQSTSTITESTTGTVTRTLELNPGYGASTVIPAGSAYINPGGDTACDCSITVTVYATINPSAHKPEVSSAFTTPAVLSTFASEAAYDHPASSTYVVQGTTISVEENSGVTALSPPAVNETSTTCTTSPIATQVSNDSGMSAKTQSGEPLYPGYSTNTPSATAISNNPGTSSSIILPPMGLIGASLCGIHTLPATVLDGTTLMTTILGSPCPSTSLAAPAAPYGAPVSYIGYESGSTPLAPYPIPIATAGVLQSTTTVSATPTLSFGGYNSSFPSYGLPPMNPSGIVTVPASSGSAPSVQLAFLIGFIALAVLV